MQVTSVRWLVRRLHELGADDLPEAGGKGANLGELIRAGLPVPPGFVLGTEAYRRFVAEQDWAPPMAFPDADLGEELRGEVAAAYEALGGGSVAVRSSATAEDLVDASFAGQQETYLNVVGLPDLLAAVRDCWASLWGERAVAYRERQGVDPDSVALAVVVQQMVPADAAGVMFTANPANGRRDEVAISAAWGLGESVVSGAVTPDDLVVAVDEKGAATAVLSRRTAAKAVRTVYADSRTSEVPVPAQLREAPVLTDEEAVELAGVGLLAARHFGRPQDLEWARGDGRLLIVQSRPITALPEPEGPVPTSWPLPDPTAWYFRASIVEQLPDPLSTLFAELIGPAVTRSLQAIMAEFLGRSVIADRDVGLPTINGYAYYRYSRSGMIRMTLRTPLVLPVLSRTGPRSGLVRWRTSAHPRYVEVVDRWRDRSVDDLSAGELLAGVADLLNAGTTYYTAVQTVIPMAASSEVIFSRFYDRLVRRSGDPAASIFLLGADSSPIRADQSLWDLARWTATQRRLCAWLTAHSAAEAAAAVAALPPSDVDPAEWQAWLHRLQQHLATFGHAVYNLDFVNAVPADQPEVVIDALRFYLGDQAVDPYERQQLALRRREEATAAVLGRVGRVRGRIFRGLLSRAQELAPAREDALADVGLAWPTMRRLLRELGHRLVRAGVVESGDDVFWLHAGEISRALAPDGAAGDLRATVADRRSVWRGQRRATPPQMLPQGFWSRRFASMMPAADEGQTGSVIKGLGASAGRVQGFARVLDGPADFAALRPGEILVASITTPAWTPLFARAAGVVTDIGGPLSHSSIVAREYGIPAVLGTAVATRRIHTGDAVAVDGDAGTVTVTAPAP